MCFWCCSLCPSFSVNDAFQFDLCRYSCLITEWRQQAAECGFPLPAMIPVVVDSSSSIDEQWASAVDQWRILNDAWSREASRRGVATSIPVLQGTFNKIAPICRILYRYKYPACIKLMM